MVNSVGATVTPERSIVLPSVVDVAYLEALLVVSGRTIRRMADSGQMPRPVKIASLVRWRLRTGDPMTGILDWIEAGCPSCRPPQRRPGR